MLCRYCAGVDFRPVVLWLAKRTVTDVKILFHRFLCCWILWSCKISLVSDNFVTKSIYEQNVPSKRNDHMPVVLQKIIGQFTNMYAFTFQYFLLKFAGKMCFLHLIIMKQMKQFFFMKYFCHKFFVAPNKCPNKYFSF